MIIKYSLSTVILKLLFFINAASQSNKQLNVQVFKLSGLTVFLITGHYVSLKVVAMWTYKMVLRCVLEHCSVREMKQQVAAALESLGCYDTSWFDNSEMVFCTVLCLKVNGQRVQGISSTCRICGHIRKSEYLVCRVLAPARIFDIGINSPVKWLYNSCSIFFFHICIYSYFIA